MWDVSIADILAVLIALVSFIYTWRSNSENKKETDRLNQAQSDIEATNQYRYVKTCRTDLMEKMQALIPVINNENISKEEKKERILSVYTSYLDFYNEINDYCSLLNHGAFTSDEVLKNTARDLLIDAADYQCDYYKTFIELSEMIDEKYLIKGPNMSRYKEYDKYLQEQLMGNRWPNLVEKRKKTKLIR